jgi:hypothetical protein
MRCQQVPSPPNSLPLASLPCAVLTMSYLWECEGDAANYHFYPIVCEGGEVVDLTAKRSFTNSSAKTLGGGGGGGGGGGDDKFWAFRSKGLRLKLSAKLSPNPEPLHLHFDGDCSPLFKDRNNNDGDDGDNFGVSPRKMVKISSEHALDPVIVVYASSFAWLANWANAFKRIPNVPYPAKCRPALDSGIWGLKAHIRGISLMNTGVDGIVKLVFFDKPRTEDQVLVVCLFVQSFVQ